MKRISWCYGAVKGKVKLNESKNCAVRKDRHNDNKGVWFEIRRRDTLKRMIGKEHLDLVENLEYD